MSVHSDTYAQSLTRPGQSPEYLAKQRLLAARKAKAHPASCHCNDCDGMSEGLKSLGFKFATEKELEDWKRVDGLEKTRKVKG